MTPSPARTDALIRRIHDAALEPALWPEALRCVVDGCGGRGGMLFTPLHGPVHGGIAVADRVPRAAIERWAAFSPDEDPYARAAVARGAFREGLVLDGDALVPEGELASTRFHRELMEPLGIGRLCTGVVFDSTDTHKLPTLLSVHRRRSDPPFAPEQLRWLERLLGPASHALGVMFHLRDRRLRTARDPAGLDRLPDGVVLLDGQGRVGFANAAARAQAAAGDPWRLAPDPAAPGAERLALAPRLRAQEAEFRRAVDGALDPLAAPAHPHFSAALVLPAADGRPACVAHVSPLGESAGPFGPAPDGIGAPRAIVFLYDMAAAAALQPGMLGALFDLSAAEAGAALQLLRGGGATAMAWRLDVSPAAFAALLRAACAKTGTQREPDLLKLLQAVASR